MKTFTTILLLAAFSLVKSTSPAADVVQKSSSSLELVLIDDHVVFSTATNISMEMIFRNVGEEKMKPYDLLLGLSVVWDGKEYGRDPKQYVAYNGLLEFGPKSGWRNRVFLSDFLIPRKVLTAGRHTVAVRDASSESNILTVFIEAQLTVAVDWAKDYRLVETQMLDSDPAGGRPLTVYVLLFPDDTRPQVFKTFDSKEMEAWLIGLPRGSVSDSSVPHSRRSGRLEWCGRTAKKKVGYSRTFQTFPAKGKCFSKLR